MARADSGTSLPDAQVSSADQRKAARDSLKKVLAAKAERRKAGTKPLAANQIKAVATGKPDKGKATPTACNCGALGISQLMTRPIRPVDSLSAKTDAPKNNP
jgi:hypothetical protein